MNFWYDSFLFADEVSSFCPDHFMAHLDVKCLFANIPLNEVIDICTDDLSCDNNKIHKLVQMHFLCQFEK